MAEDAHPGGFTCARRVAAGCMHVRTPDSEESDSGDDGEPDLEEPVLGRTSPTDPEATPGPPVGPQRLFDDDDGGGRAAGSAPASTPAPAVPASASGSVAGAAERVSERTLHRCLAAQRCTSGSGAGATVLRQGRCGMCSNSHACCCHRRRKSGPSPSFRGLLHLPLALPRAATGAPRQATRVDDRAAGSVLQRAPLAASKAAVVLTSGLGTSEAPCAHCADPSVPHRRARPAHAAVLPPRELALAQAPRVGTCVRVQCAQLHWPRRLWRGASRRTDGRAERVNGREHGRCS